MHGFVDLPLPKRNGPGRPASSLRSGRVSRANSVISTESPLSTTPVEDGSSSPVERVASRHVRLVDDNNQELRDRRSRMGRSKGSQVRSPSSYSARSAYSRAHSSGARTPIDPHSPRASLSTLHLQHLLENLEMDQYDTFGVEEVRDGFFDATFYRSSQQGRAEFDEDWFDEEFSLREWFRKFWRTQVDDTSWFWMYIQGKQEFLQLFKSFIGYFIAYIICLIPAVQRWLGRYSYWVVISALFNHAGRTAGAQLDGTFFIILGGAFGCAAGALALELSSLTTASRAGYGGVIAAVYVVFMIIIAWIRCSLLRLYQSMMVAGMALTFLCVVDTDIIAAKNVWATKSLWRFGLPWLIGLAICLLVNLLIFPETGGKGIALAIHNALESSIRALELPRPYSVESRSDMSAQLVHISEAVRHMRNELIYTSLSPSDAWELRNILQSVIRELMAIKPESDLFDYIPKPTSTEESSAVPSDIVIDIDISDSDDVDSVRAEEVTALDLFRRTMAVPTRQLVDAMINMLRSCDHRMMEVIGQPGLSERKQSVDVHFTQVELQNSIKQFDDADISLIDHPDLPSSYAQHLELVEQFLFIHPIRQTAGAIDKLASKVLEISAASQKKRLFLPSYPWKRAIYRTNPQVAHDRGGINAGYYFRVKQDIQDIMDRIHARAYSLDPEKAGGDIAARNITSEGPMTAEQTTFRYKTWKVLHRIQQFESRFAVKVVIVMGALSIPAWVPQSRKWWVDYEAWWAPLSAWFMLHPRVGGNAQDLVTRTIATILGAVWGGLAVSAGDRAGSGRPYVVAVFAAIFMVPAIFRFTMSSHPRSGLMACLSFTVISLSAYNPRTPHTPVQIAWTHALALIIGLFTAVMTNWLIWPFVARHELRKSLSSMLLNLGISYRVVVARFIYHDPDYEPTPADIEMSEIQEAKLREGCYCMREIAELTRHEIRPRGPFDPTPFTEAITACERFLEHVVEVRQSSLYFQPYMFQGSPEANHKLISVRRDAVASVMLNLYVLASALRSKRPVPRYLPSAAATRKRLLDKMGEVEAEFNEEKRARRAREEAEMARERGERGVVRVETVRERGARKERRWADVYHYAYSAALTDIVGQVELLEKLTKAIEGEMELDAVEYIKRD